MDRLWQDVRYGARMMAKRPGVTAIAIVAMALSIGANTTVFAPIQAYLLAPVPFEDKEQLVTVEQVRTPRGRRGTNVRDFVNWREHSQSFQQLSAYRFRTWSLAGEGEAERVDGVRVSAAFFPMLRVRPIIGRFFTDQDDRAGAAPLALISEALWQRRFGGRAEVLGRSVRLDGVAHTIIGVVPEGLRFPAVSRGVWTPIGQDLDPVRRGDDYADIVGRLKPGVRVAAARDELTAMTALAGNASPGESWGVALETLEDAYVRGGPKPVLQVLMGVVVFVLLIACANVANLLLARAVDRKKEVAIRMAMGAGRARIVRQMLVESILLSLAGAAGGILLATWGLRVMLAAVPAQYLAWSPIRVDLPVLAFSMALAVLTGILFGVAPAFEVVRSKLGETLKEGGRTSGLAGGRGRLRRALVVIEVALALVLLAGATLMAKSFLNLYHRELGYRIENTLAARIDLAGPRYEKALQRAEFYAQAVDRLARLPGVESAAAQSGYGWSPILIAGRPAPPPERPVWVLRRSVTPEWFRTMDVPLRCGRHFTLQDDERAPEVAIVNETAAGRFWPGEDPIGRQLKLDTRTGRPWITVAGVVRDVRRSPYADIEPEAFLAHRQDPRAGMTLYVHTAAGAASLAAAVRAEIRALDPNVAVADLRTQEAIVNESLVRDRIPAILISVFAGIALLLAAMGLYGVISYSVSQRTHEMGVRMALGAGRGDLVRLVVAQGMRLALTGAVLGLALAYATTRVLARLLYGVSTTDARIFAGVTIVLLAVAAAASLIPARRAAAVRPIEALRYE